MSQNHIEDFIAVLQNFDGYLGSIYSCLVKADGMLRLSALDEIENAIFSHMDYYSIFQENKLEAIAGLYLNPAEEPDTLRYMTESLASMKVVMGHFDREDIAAKVSETAEYITGCKEEMANAEAIIEALASSLS